MEEMNSNTTEVYDYVNESNYNNGVDDSTIISECPGMCITKILNLINRIIIGIGFLLILLVMIAVFSQVRKGLDAPIYVINLLVSDIIQLCCRIPTDFTTQSENHSTYFIIANLGTMVSVGFMVCISCERYLIITKPLWYRFRRKSKKYVVVCIVVWILPVLYPVLGYGTGDSKTAAFFLTGFYLLPCPVFIFFLVGTIKALSGARGVPADEKRRIVAIQVAVLIIYTLLYLPVIILFLSVYGAFDIANYKILHSVALVCVFLSPLADTTLYLFTRKTILDKFLASICSCKISNILETISTESRTETNTETV